MARTKVEKQQVEAPAGNLALGAAVEKKELVAALARVVGVADKRSTMQVLSNVLVEARGEGLKFAATDLYLSASTTASARVGKPGSVAVPAHALLERARTLPDGAVLLSSETGADLVVRSAANKRQFTLRAMPGEDFPPVPSADGGEAVYAGPASELLSLVEPAKHAVSEDVTRQHMNSLLVDFSRPAAVACATDGHRLAKVERKLAGTTGTRTTPMLVPLSAVREFSKLLAAAGEERVELRVDKSMAFFLVGTTVLGVKLVEATFPPYDQVIPKRSETTAVVDREALAAAVSAVSLASESKTGGVRFTLARGAVRVSAESADEGSARDEVPAEYEGRTFEIGFSARYVLAALAATDRERVALRLSGELDPLRIDPVGDDSVLFVIMPVRI